MKAKGVCVGSYQSPKWRPNQIQICIGMANPLYYDNLEIVKNNWTQYIFEDGRIYEKVEYVMKTKLINTELTIETHDRTIIIDVHKQPFESLFTLDDELYTVKVNNNEITINKA